MKRVSREDRESLSIPELLQRYPLKAVHEAVDAAANAVTKRNGRKPLPGDEVSVWLAVSILLATTGKGLTWVSRVISKRLLKQKDSDIIIDTHRGEVMWEGLRQETVEKIYRRAEKRRNADMDAKLQAYLDAIKDADPAALVALPYRVASSDDPGRAGIVILGNRK